MTLLGGRVRGRVPREQKTSLRVTAFVQRRNFGERGEKINRGSTGTTVTKVMVSLRLVKGLNGRSGSERRPQRLMDDLQNLLHVRVEFCLGFEISTSVENLDAKNV